MISFSLPPIAITMYEDLEGVFTVVVRRTKAHVTNGTGNLKLTIIECKQNHSAIALFFIPMVQIHSSIFSTHYNSSLTIITMKEIIITHFHELYPSREVIRPTL